MPRPRFDRPIAHRGLHNRSAGIIENSASAFARAIDRGFAIECDLQLSSDGVPIVFHDQGLSRLTARKGNVRETSAADLTRMTLVGSASGDRPQRFTEFLAQVGGRVMLQVELKPQEGQDRRRLARAAVEAARSYSGPLTFESFDPGLLREVRRAGFRGPVGIAVERFDGTDAETAALSRWKRIALRHLLHRPYSRFDFISCDQKSLDLPLVRLHRKMGIPVTAWTIRTPSAAAAVAPHADQIVFEGFDPDRA